LAHWCTYPAGRCWPLLQLGSSVHRHRTREAYQQGWGGCCRVPACAPSVAVSRESCAPSDGRSDRKCGSISSDVGLHICGIDASQGGVVITAVSLTLRAFIVVDSSQHLGGCGGLVGVVGRVWAVVMVGMMAHFWGISLGGPAGRDSRIALALLQKCAVIILVASLMAVWDAISLG
jgi:hypothetical protein